MFGIIAALEGEVKDIKKEMTEITEVICAGLVFYVGHLYEKSVVVVKCGVGKVNAGLCTQALIDKFNVNKIINVGVAGALGEGLTVGDIVISKDSLQYDMDATAFGHPRGEIPNMGKTVFEADPGLIALAVDSAKKINIKVRVGRVLTADIGVDSPALKNEIRSLFGGECVEMEGAAVGQVAYVNTIPYLIIRSISDNADGSLMKTYKDSFELSVKNAAKMVLEIVRNN